MDFTLITYNQLLQALLAQVFTFQLLSSFIQAPATRVIILRHDVDRLPGNALKTALLEHDLGISASYYFRIVKKSYDENIIKQIADLGHEIGYHYEDLDLSSRGQWSVVSGQKGLDYDALLDKAIKSFELNLEKLREFYPVKTICMHGSPLSKYDNRELWEKYDYRDFGIIAEPYFDVDYDEVFYLTDTGRRWDGEKVSVRDKVGSQRSEVRGQKSEVGGWRSNDRRQRTEGKEDKEIRGLEVKQWPSFHSTFDIIAAVEKGLLPDRVMINTHPQRWTDKPLPWVRELLWQNFKNLIKQYFYVRK